MGFYPVLAAITLSHQSPHPKLSTVRRLIQLAVVVVAGAPVVHQRTVRVHIATLGLPVKWITL